MTDHGKPLELHEFTAEVAKAAGISPAELGRREAAADSDVLLDRAHGKGAAHPDRRLETVPEALQGVYESYEEAMKYLRQIHGITEIGGRLTYTDVLGEPQPVPPWPAIENQFIDRDELLLEKMNQGFRTLVLVPFGMKTQELVHACLERADGNARAGNLRTPSGSSCHTDAVHLEDRFGIMSMTDTERILYAGSGNMPFAICEAKERILANDHLAGWQALLVREGDISGDSGLGGTGSTAAPELPDSTALGSLEVLFSERLKSGERFMTLEDYWTIALMQQSCEPWAIQGGTRLVLANCIKSPNSRVPVVGIEVDDPSLFTYHLRSMSREDFIPPAWKVPTVVPI